MSATFGDLRVYRGKLQVQVLIPGSETRWRDYSPTAYDGRMSDHLVSRACPERRTRFQSSRFTQQDIDAVISLLSLKS